MIVQTRNRTHPSEKLIGLRDTTFLYRYRKNGDLRCHFSNDECLKRNKKKRLYFFNSKYTGVLAKISTDTVVSNVRL